MTVGGKTKKPVQSDAEIRAAAMALRFQDMSTERIQSMPGRVSDLVGLVNTLMVQRAQMLKTLVGVRDAIAKSEHWWISSPDRGGFDIDAINAAIAEGVKPL